MPYFSIILPAYNIAEFLPEALESLLCQTDPDFELLLVDDGSTDGTGAICDEYARKDARVCTIHQKNAGAHTARNAAIDLASGEYLFFMDGDDRAEPGMLAAMRDVAEKTHAELVIFGFYIDTHYAGGTPSVEKKSHPDAYYPNAASFRRAAVELFDQNLLYPPWNKLFLTSRVNAQNIRFRKTMWDDFPFNLDYIRDVQTVAVDARAYYHFLRGLRKSETSKYFSGMGDKREEEHRDLLDLYAHWNLADDPKVQEMLARRYVERVFGVLENIVCRQSPLSPREKRAAIRKLIRSREVRESARRAQSRSIHMKLMLLVILTGSARLTHCLSRLISYAKVHCRRTFTYLKRHR